MEIKCEICDKSFSSQSCFILHIAEHYPEQKIQCDCCDKQFKTYQSLKGHLESVHKKVKKRSVIIVAENTPAGQQCIITSSLLMKTRNISVHCVTIKLQRWAILHDINIQSMKV